MDKLNTYYKLSMLFLFCIGATTFVNAQSCLNFDGQNDQVEVPVAVSQAISSDFTLEAKINGLENNVGAATILSNRTSTNAGFHFFIHNYWGGSDHKMLSLRYNNTNWLFINNGDYNGKLLDGNCHHVAVSKIGGTISFYIDGILIGKRENQPDLDVTTNAPILIGADRTSTDYFSGSINDVRIWSVGRSQSEIISGINNDVSVDAEGLLGSWKLNDGDGQIVSDEKNMNPGLLGSVVDTETNDPSWGEECCSDTPVEEVNCLSFDGVDDQVSIPLEVGQALGSQDFTLEAQIQGNEADNSTGTILSNRASFNSGFTMFTHNYWGGSDHMMLTFRYNGVNWLFIDNGDYNGKLLDGDCHHVAITKIDGTLTFYIDGIIVGIRENQPDINLNSNMPIVVGRDGFSGDPFNGVINDVRIWSTGRSQQEILESIDNGVDPSTDGLLGYWEMREGSGQVLTDLTNQNDAQLGSLEGIDSNDPPWNNRCCGNGIILDINEIESKEDFVSIYPNPSSGAFYLEFNTTFVPNQYNYTIYDNMGRVMESKVLSSQHLNLDRLHTGNYFIKITDAKKIVSVSKLAIIK